jgi:hypothetical protein
MLLNACYREFPAGGIKKQPFLYETAVIPSSVKAPVRIIGLIRVLDISG